MNSTSPLAGTSPVAIVLVAITRFCGSWTVKVQLPDPLPATNTEIDFCGSFAGMKVCLAVSASLVAVGKV